MPPLIHRDILPKDLDTKKDPSLAELNARLREIYRQLNVLQGYHGPIPLAGDIDLNGFRIKNLGAPQNSSDALSQTGADPLYSTKTQQAAMEALGAKMLQTARRLNDRTQQHKISTDLNLQGAIPPTITGLTTYTATATTITVSFPTMIQYGDLSLMAIPNQPVTSTGIIAGTYFIYPYYDTNLGVGTLVTDSAVAVGSPPFLFAAQNANAAQAQNSDGRVPLSVGAISVTVAGGGSGGGGGSGCIRVGMLVEEKERGVIAIEAAFIGDMLRARKGWTRVTARRSGTSLVFIRLVLGNGDTIDITPTHPICLFAGGHKEAGELTLSDVLCGAEGLPLQILSLLTVKESSATVLLSCDPTHEYLVGRTTPSLVAHNVIQPK